MMKGVKGLGQRTWRAFSNSLILIWYGIGRADKVEPWSWPGGSRLELALSP